MKYLFIIMILVSCCTPKKATIVQTKTDTVHVIVRDTVVLHDTIFVTDNTAIKQLNNKLFLANFKIERVRYYLKICQRRPSQVKFLVSWIHRAIN